MVYIIYIWAGRYMHIVDEVNWMLEVEECVRRVFGNGRSGVGSGGRGAGSEEDRGKWMDITGAAQIEVRDRRQEGGGGGGGCPDE